MGRNLLKDGDILSGAALAGLGVYIIVQARGWDYLGPDGPGPGFFPLWYGIAIVALSLLLVLNAVRARQEQPAIDWPATLRALATWAAFAGAIALMQWLGFVISFALLTLFVVVVIFGRPLATGAATAVAAALGFYLVFPLALDVPLPVGPFGF